MLLWLSIWRVWSPASDLPLILTHASFSFKPILNFASEMRQCIHPMGLMEYLHLISSGTVLQTVEPFISVLPHIKVQGHCYWQDAGEKGNTSSDTLLTPHFAKLLVATRNGTGVLAQPHLLTACSPLPKRVCYSPSCVTRRRVTLVSHLRLWTERSGGACAEYSCTACSSPWLLPPVEACAGYSCRVCTCNPKLEGMSQRDWGWEGGRASTGSWPGRGPHLIPSAGAYANCARLLTQGECGVSHQIRTRGT